MRNVLVALGIVLVTASIAVADNTVESSAMYFEGVLANPSGGVYTGTIAMADETGFDVYAKNGAWATYDLIGGGGSDYTSGTVTGHDAYQQGGGWGATYDPDCADWDNYQLRLTSDHWYLEYNGNVGNDGILTGADACPMSGAMNWGAMYASEDDTGAYYASMGTPENPNGAATFATSKGQSTAGAWDMDWSWGSDYVPLEYPGFSVEVELLDEVNGIYGVTLTPTPEPGTIVMLIFGGLTALGAVWFRRRRA